MKPSLSFPRLLTAIKGLACLACASMVAPPAFAVPTVYNFTTAPGPNSYSPGLGGIFSSTDVVSGSFVYDPDSPVTGTGTYGVTIYGYAPPPVVSSYSSLAGTAGTYAFSDPRGYVTVGNDQTQGPGTPALDSLVYYADTFTATGPHNFVGFTTGGYTMVNLRIFWIESIDIPDFLPDQTLPAAPPTFLGRLALDFVPADNPTLPASSFIFFNGVKVTPAVPGTCN
jgi:hypothetical protein